MLPLWLDSERNDSRVENCVQYHPMSIFTKTPRVTPKLDEVTEQLQTRLLRLVGQTIAEYSLIEDGDRVMVWREG